MILLVDNIGRRAGRGHSFIHVYHFSKQKARTISVVKVPLDSILSRIKQELHKYNVIRNACSGQHFLKSLLSKHIFNGG